MLRTRAPYGPLTLCDGGCNGVLAVKSSSFEGVGGELHGAGWTLTEVQADGTVRWAVTCPSCKVHPST